MISRTQINIIVFVFMVLVGCALAYGIQAHSITGISLSLTSLGAGVYFLHLLTKGKREYEQEKEEAL